MAASFLAPLALQVGSKGIKHLLDRRAQGQADRRQAQADALQAVISNLQGQAAPPSGPAPMQMSQLGAMINDPIVLDLVQRLFGNKDVDRLVQQSRV